MFFFFFNDTATTEIYTLSLHDALPILTLTLPSSTLTVHLPAPSMSKRYELVMPAVFDASARLSRLSKNSFTPVMGANPRSEEHTSELQSRLHLVCRLLLEKIKIQ